MSWIPRTVFCLCLLSVGYVVGTLHVAAPSPLSADPTTESVQGALRDKLRDADRVMSEAMQMLQDEKRATFPPSLGSTPLPRASAVSMPSPISNRDRESIPKPSPGCTPARPCRKSPSIWHTMLKAA